MWRDDLEQVEGYSCKNVRRNWRKPEYVCSGNMQSNVLCNVLGLKTGGSKGLKEERWRFVKVSTEWTIPVY